MLDLKLKNINNPFEMRQGEKIADLDRYVEVLKEKIFLLLKSSMKKLKRT